MAPRGDRTGSFPPRWKLNAGCLVNQRALLYNWSIKFGSGIPHRVTKEELWVHMAKNKTQVEEIKSAITLLPRSDLIDLVEWFRSFEAQVWDAQIEEDIRAGKLDRLAEDALADFEAGRCTEL